ncbi:sensor histidine kinase [Sporosarcina koreensis]|uniref:sensor histidine kinase n=1 Tax=Sporosarcina koreensis TaxID=334735 RepID=UPI0005908AF0|nr:HAMP domain-containing sensor histidine kinase [Sporosarcina koreensis]
MNKISTKLAAAFIVSFLVMDTALMLYLHHMITDARVEEELDRLLEAGGNHRDVLEDNFSDRTLAHIFLMERGDRRSVAVLDSDGRPIGFSSGSEERFSPYLPDVRDMAGADDRILSRDWKSSPYLVGVHPFRAGADSGTLVMLQSTAPIRQLVSQLNVHFLLAGGGSLVILVFVYWLLSKWLTRPLIRMKEAAEQMSDGSYDVDLPVMQEDELGELAAAIRKLSGDLRRVKRERNEFLASVSHEMGTPLTYLKGYTRVAQRPDLPEDERTRYLSIIEEEAARLESLVKDLMALARMDEMTFSVEKTDFEAEEFIHTVLQLVKPAYDAKGIALHLILSGDFTVQADRMRLEQIVLNLLDNALHYSESGTAVTVRMAREQKQTVLQIEDEGRGIPVDEQPYVFDKLYRVEKSRSRAFGGAGLGLAIVKELTEAHGGTIRLDSEPGRGSIFTIRL